MKAKKKSRKDIMIDKGVNAVQVVFGVLGVGVFLLMVFYVLRFCSGSF